MRLDDAEAGVGHAAADRARQVPRACQHDEIPGGERGCDFEREANCQERLRHHAPALGVLIEDIA